MLLVFLWVASAALSSFNLVSAQKSCCLKDWNSPLSEFNESTNPLEVLASLQKNVVEILRYDEHKSNSRHSSCSLETAVARRDWYVSTGTGQ